MIVVFGASSDIGTRLVQTLSKQGKPVRAVSRSAPPGQVYADLSNGKGVKEAIADATIVVSCAHARFTKRILRALPASVESVILVGSAWRYSQVTNPRADEVREAEQAFIESGRDGVMLHPTMIYGGRQENNIARLLSAIRRLPVIPAPGGGRQVVQPIYIEDVAACLLAAVARKWHGPNIVPLGGPALSWREMVAACAQSIGYSRPIMGVPTLPIMWALNILSRCGLRRFDPGIIRRFREDVNVPLTMMRNELGVEARDFKTGIGLAVAYWRQQGVLP